MAGHIPRSFIDDLLARLDIVEIVDARVKLKKQGKNFTACCPFHNEKTPSFSVSREKQFYHCFGCGVSGNAINFIMEHDRLDFVEAIDELANHLGLVVPYENNSGNFSQSNTDLKIKHNIYKLLEQISLFYQAQLKSPAGKIAMDYLNNREINLEIIKKFNIGYVPDKWDSLIKHFDQNHSELISSGMVIENDSKRRYDRFRSRVMFPIKDKRGRVIGFGGRVLTNETPKYLNSPETAVFHKGRELYGFYEVLQAHKNPKQLLVVEGYMDVVALAQYGIDYAVAALGTATSSEHLQMLFRQSPVVICCYDGDRAGREAAWRAMENALPHLTDGRQLKFIFLPDGEDPDSIVHKEGKENFELRLSKAQSLSEFLFSTLMKDINSRSYEGKTQIASTALPLIEKLPNGALREQLEYNLGERIGFAFDHQLKKVIRTNLASNKPKPQNFKQTPMRTAITLLIQNPNFVQHVPSLAEINAMPISGIQLLTDLVELCKQHPNITTGQLIEYCRETEHYRLLTKLASWMLQTNDENALNVFLDSLDKIFTQGIEYQVDKLQEKERSIGLTAEERRELWQLLQSESV